jgi:undecaprenyl-diphosphatase
VITFFQAIVLGFLQGVSELFPISSLGHSVLFAWLFNWHNILIDQSKSESFFLSFLVVLHVATATALLIFYRRTWLRIIKGFFRSLKNRQIDSADGQLAWLLVVASIPAGLTGLLLEKVLRLQFAKPLSAIIFLFINSLILFSGDAYQKRAQTKHVSRAEKETTQNISQRLSFKTALIIGVAQIGALCAGISRSGITMVSGLYNGLSHEDAARFSFLLATPIIFGAGLISLPDFFGSLDNGVRGQILAGGAVAGIAAYFTVRYLDKYFQDKTLKPFAIYCLTASIALFILGLIRGHF